MGPEEAERISGQGPETVLLICPRCEQERALFGEPAPACRSKQRSGSDPGICILCLAELGGYPLVL